MTLTVGIVLKPGIPEALEGLESLLPLLPDARVIVEGSGYHALVEPPSGVQAVDPTVFDSECDLVVVFGGDGTLIHAASLLRARTVPILGINLGHLGFMTEVSRDEMARAVELALAGELPHTDRMRLDVEVHVRVGDDAGRIERRRVINDVVLGPRTMARIATYRVSLDGELVTAIRGDGVIVSTPTGSTAYSMAAGGSILAPGLEGIAITPICPHQLSQRPVVLSAQGELSIQLDSETEAFATFDGQAGREFRYGDVVTVRKAPVPARLLSVPWRSYFQTLRAKLHWGDS